MLLIYLVYISIYASLCAVKKLSVTSVSTLDSTSYSKALYGSSLGGSILYIKGTGFK